MLTPRNTTMLVFQLQSYYTFNIIFYATLKTFHYWGAGSEIILYLKLPNNGHLFEKLYHLQNCQWALKLSRSNSPRMLFPCCLKQSLWGCPNLNWTCSWNKSSFKPLGKRREEKKKKKSGVGWREEEKNFQMPELPKLTLYQMLWAPALAEGTPRWGGGGKAGYQHTLHLPYLGISSGGE